VDGVEAFQRGSVGLFELLPRYYSDARCWREDGLLIMIAGQAAATFNGVLVLDQNALTAERLVVLEKLFASERVPIAFEFYSHATAAISDDLLTQHGYSLIVCDPIMVCEGALRVPQEVNPEVLIRALGGEEDRIAYRRIMSEAFKMPPNTVKELFDAMLKIGEGHQMLAWLNGNPVGCGMLLYTNGIATIYNVATLPSEQKRGVGTAMMVALHRRALEDGFGATALAVQSEEGLSLYKSLGYRQDGYQLIYAFS
jgi:ribosomal protein S18 acetylase RimI-like enzyme